MNIITHNPEIYIPVLMKEPVLFIDLETNALHPVDGGVTLISIATITKSVFVFRAEEFPWEVARNLIFENHHILKVFHNAVFDYGFLYGLGINTHPIGCTYIAEMLLTAGRDDIGCSLADIVKRRLNVSLDKAVRKDFTSGVILSDVHIQYSALDVYYLPDIYFAQQKEIEQLCLTDVYRLECSIIRVTALMEFYGVRVDCEKLLSYRAPLVEFEKTQASIFQDIAIVSGYSKEIVVTCDGYSSINVNSRDQFLGLLNHIGIDLSTLNIKDITEWDITHISRKTDYDSMLPEFPGLGFRNIVIQNHIARSFAENVVSTFIDGILDRVNKSTGRIYPNFNQLGAKSTGRYSSSNPNFQNLVKREKFATIGFNNIDIRSVFIPEPGNSFVIADYSAIELVIAACFAEDEKLLEQISAGDVHSYIATYLFGVEVNAENKKKHPYSVLRDCSKRLTYANLYGTSGWNLERTLGHDLNSVGIIVRPGDGDRWLQMWAEAFPKTGAFLRINANHAVTRGYVTTVLNRRRNWNTQFQSQKQYHAAMREGSNAAIQGSCADMLKYAMYLIASYFDYPQQRIVASVHDEIITEQPEEQSEYVAGIVRYCMEEAGYRLFPIARKYKVIKAEPKISYAYDK